MLMLFCRTQSCCLLILTAWETRLLTYEISVDCVSMQRWLWSEMTQPLFWFLSF